MNQKKVVSYRSNQMTFTVPNGLNQYRISNIFNFRSELREYVLLPNPQGAGFKRLDDPV